MFYKTSTFFSRVVGLCCALALLVVLYRAYLSLQWINTHDTGFMYYLSWLINKHGFAPYRDVLDTSFPGSFLFYMLVVELFGYSSIAFHVTDIIFLLLLLGMTWLLIKPVAGKRAALVAVSVYALSYFANKPELHFERDYLALFPIVSALLLSQSILSIPHGFRFIFIGFLFTLAASIKPQLAIGLPVVFIANLYRRYDTKQAPLTRKAFIQSLLYCCAGLVLCVSGFALWLQLYGSLDAFVDMATHYLPAYLLPDSHVTASDSLTQWISNAWNSSGKKILPRLLKELSPYWLVGLIGCYWCWINAVSRQEKILALTLAALLPLYFISIYLGLRAWPYHEMPFMYLSLISGALVFMPRSQPCHAYQVMAVVLPGIFLYVLFSLHIIPTARGIIHNADKNIAQRDAAATLVRFMNEHALHTAIDLSREQAQPITTPISPILPVMQILKLTIPTRFPECWFCYYPYLKDPRINTYRQELIATLKKTQPRYLFLDKDYESLMLDSNGSSGFPELTQMISSEYYKIYQTDGILVYERLVKK